ncbi:MAG: hypothetical protein DRN17_00570, partial [Thermoplasmata archaeon]
YIEGTNQVSSVYTLIRGAEEIISNVDAFPSISGDSFGSISPDTHYTQTHTDESGHRSEYLANYLVSEYGIAQNIAGVWDESSGVIINDSSLSIEREAAPIGHRLITKCSNAEPMMEVSKYINIAMFSGVKPFDISTEFLIVAIVIGTINGYDVAADERARLLHEAGDTNGASYEIIKEMTNQLSVSFFPNEMGYRAHPLQYTMQGPWAPPKVTLAPEELMIFADDLTYTIKAKSRQVLVLKVGEGNSIEFNIPGRKLGHMYTIVDGYVHEEVSFDEKKTPIQRGDTSYSLRYEHHVAGDVILDRDITVDLDVYPARQSYPSNNVIRELISPIREDGHSKKMDARAVYVRFDTRYIYESIESYYDKFIEMPTAFTCDSVPEEAVFNTEFGLGDFRFKDLMTNLSGDDVFAGSSFVNMSFDNPSEEDIELSLKFDNDRQAVSFGSQGRGSLRINDLYPIKKAGILTLGWDTEFPHGRVKNGIKLKNTEIGE